jgi:hypothetical protein
MTGAAITTGFVMTDLIKAQAFESAVMLCAGMTVALLYELFCCLKNHMIARKYAAAFLEVIFWLGAGIMTSEFLYYCCFGELSVHAICAFISGVLLWTFVFCGKISKGDRKCLNERRKKEVENSRI